MEGSSPKTSSPTGALIIASSMAGVGFVTVSDLKSMIMKEIYLQYTSLDAMSLTYEKCIRFARWQMTDGCWPDLHLWSRFYNTLPDLSSSAIIQAVRPSK